VYDRETAPEARVPLLRVRAHAGADTAIGMARPHARIAQLILFAAVIAGPACAWATGLGSRLSPFVLMDQHGKPHRIDASVRAIVLTRDMDAGDIVKVGLGTHGKSILEKHHAVYIADLSSMPGFIRSWLAIPQLKDRPYPMLIDSKGDVSKSLPSRDHLATLIFLDSMQITAVEYVTQPAALVPALSAPKRFAAK
jgi:hypothetical protein